MYPRLVADIGGTNARFSVCFADNVLLHSMTFPAQEFETIERAIGHYLDTIDISPVAACFAIASPITGDRVKMTNHHWDFSISAVQRQFGWEALAVINDFQAIALSLPYLRKEQYLSLGDGHPASHAPRCVMGPGTGLGVALLIPCNDGFVSIPTEGGHATVAPATENELAVFRYWMGKGLSPSREHLVSGPGLVRLYQAHCALNNQRPRAKDPAAVYDLATNQGDHLAHLSLAMFFALLGRACGDQALATGARGGILLAGGIFRE